MALVVSIKGVDYPLAATLRVAYKVQGQHNHKAYSKVFSEIGDMVLEDQIGILYCSFQCANPGVQMSQQEFLNHYLDNCTLKEVMNQVKEVVQGITGASDEGRSCPVCGAEVEGNFCPNCGAKCAEPVATEATDEQGN